MRHVSIGRMMPKEILFGLQCILEILVGLNILLGPVDHTDKPELQRVHPSLENLKSICSVVHQVNLRKNTNSSLSLRVNLSGKFEGF